MGADFEYLRELCEHWVFPKELVRAPRAWTERQLSDIRRWTEMPRGGHFAALEEPELLVEDLLAFLDGL